MISLWTNLSENVHNRKADCVNFVQKFLFGLEWMQSSWRHWLMVYG